MPPTGGDDSRSYWLMHDDEPFLPCFSRSRAISKSGEKPSSSSSSKVKRERRHSESRTPVKRRPKEPKEETPKEETKPPDIRLVRWVGSRVSYVLRQKGNSVLRCLGPRIGRSSQL